MCVLEVDFFLGGGDPVTQMNQFVAFEAPNPQSSCVFKVLGFVAVPGGGVDALWSRALPQSVVASLIPPPPPRHIPGGES